MSMYKNVPSHDADIDDDVDNNNVVALEFASDDAIMSEELTSTVGSSVVTVFMVPILLIWIVLACEFTGRLWSAAPFVFHLQIRLNVSRAYFECCMNKFQYGNYTHEQKRRKLKRAMSFAAFYDILMLGIVYPAIAIVVINVLFMDVDGTIHLDWIQQTILLKVLTGLGIVVAILRLYFCTFIGTCIKRKTKLAGKCSSRNTLEVTTEQNILTAYRLANWLVFVVTLLTVLSLATHFGPGPTLSFASAEECSPLDSTLCALPFPSFRHLEADPTTVTGYRVHVKGLPPLKGGLPLHPDFVNELDGFSTMAPILFYLDGLKELHEHEAGYSNQTLQGPEHIEQSVTNLSVTLLINVDDQVLLPHSAEIDYLDPDRPLVMVIPARPLQHNTHYAVAVVNAVDAQGKLLAQSPGLKSVLLEDVDFSPAHIRFTENVLPSLYKAAPWVGVQNDHEALQLLFDFKTISEESQLGPIRKVRDGTLSIVEKWDWNEHVELVSVVNHECTANGDDLIARTYHIMLDAPTFLKDRNRYSVLDHSAVDSGESNSMGHVKAMIQLPCTIDGGDPVTAIVDYGHGLFNKRDEVTDEFLSRCVVCKFSLVLFSSLVLNPSHLLIYILYY